MANFYIFTFIAALAGAFFPVKRSAVVSKRINITVY